MWTIYNIRRNCYWNEQRRTWGGVDEATLYTLEERDLVTLRSISAQWRFVDAPPAALPNGAVTAFNTL